MHLGTVVSVQSPRIATTAEALIASPLFFHGKQIVIRHGVAGDVEPFRLDATSKPVFVFFKEKSGPSAGELRGEFWDLGRIPQGDSRFSAYDFTRVLEMASRGQWPSRDSVFVMINAERVDSPLPPAPTVRAIALAPDKYVDREVKITGRFRGRNLYGDLPQALNKSKWDFVLQSADAAIWISGVRPRGKDFDLDPAARVDTGRWLEVIGTVRQQNALLWVEATQIGLSTPPKDVPVEIQTPVRPPEPAPRVVFSAPVADEVEVERTTTVRLQFSRIMRGESFQDRVKVSYVGRVPPGATPPAPPQFTATYNDGLRALEIKFAQPLERFQTVKVELLEGITAADAQPLLPWSLTFSTGS